jgi:hypothetical protein
MATETPEEKKKRLQAEAAARAKAQRERQEAEAQAAAEQPSSVQGRTQKAAAEFKPDMGLKRGGRIKKYTRGDGVSRVKTKGRLV